MKKVLITGVDGFTGRYLAPVLSRAGFEVHGLVRSSPVVPVVGCAQLHVGSLVDVTCLREIVRRIQPSKVAHLAAVAFVAHGDIDAIYRTNVVGTRNLLEVLTQEKSFIDAILLASSANIYGNSVGGLLNESTPAAPANDYAVSKLAMEYVAKTYARKLPIIVSRPFNYTGVGQGENFLIPKIISYVRQRASVIELGNIDVARDFSDVRVLVQYYLRLLENPEAIGGTFNVCSGSSYALETVLEMAQSISGHSLNVRINQEFVRANEVKVLCGDNTLLMNTVGEVPPIAIQDTIRWMLETPTSVSS